MHRFDGTDHDERNVKFLFKYLLWKLLPLPTVITGSRSFYFGSSRLAGVTDGCAMGRRRGHGKGVFSMHPP